jgi:hypothetical protein
LGARLAPRRFSPQKLRQLAGIHSNPRRLIRLLFAANFNKNACLRRADINSKIWFTCLGKRRRSQLKELRHLGDMAAIFRGLVQRRQAETCHLLEDNIGLTATVVRLMGIMAIDYGTVV